MDETQTTTPAAPTTQPYTQWIIIGVLVLGGLYVIQHFFFSPERMMERAFEAETGGQYDIDVDKANEGNVTYTSTEGDKIQVATGEDLKLPDTWPETLPVFPNGKITYAGTVNTTENTTGLMVSYTVSNSASDVIAFYKEKLAANGWVIGVVSETTSGSMVSATNASEDSVALYAVTSNGETTVSLTAELKK